MLTKQETDGKETWKRQCSQELSHCHGNETPSCKLEEICFSCHGCSWSHIGWQIRREGKFKTPVIKLFIWKAYNLIWVSLHLNHFKWQAQLRGIHGFFHFNLKNFSFYSSCSWKCCSYSPYILGMASPWLTVVTLFHYRFVMQFELMQHFLSVVYKTELWNDCKFMIPWTMIFMWQRCFLLSL